MSDKVNKILFRIHIIFLIIAVGKTLCKITNQTLSKTLINQIKLVYINFYYLCYAFTGFFYGLAIVSYKWILGIIIFTFLVPLRPINKQYESNNICINEPFVGLLGSCCKYEVKERVWGIFLKDHGYLKLEGEGGPINLESIQIKHLPDRMVISYETAWDKTEKVQVLEK